MANKDQMILVKLLEPFGAHETGALVKTTRAELEAAGLKRGEHWKPRGTYTGGGHTSTLHAKADGAPGGAEEAQGGAADGERRDDDEQTVVGHE